MLSERPKEPHILNDSVNMKCHKAGKSIDKQKLSGCEGWKTMVQGVSATRHGF